MVPPVEVDGAGVTERAPYIAAGLEAQYYVRNWAALIGLGGGRNFFPERFETAGGEYELRAAGGFLNGRLGVGLFF
jgi:hypothetical protein